jgi:hypothetical protein
MSKQTAEWLTEMIQAVGHLPDDYFDAVKKLAIVTEQLAAANEENFKFRQALWLLNGDVFKYGDDGEMQSLGVDYKRGSADIVIQTTTREIQKTSKQLTAANARLEEAERVIDNVLFANSECFLMEYGEGCAIEIPHCEPCAYCLSADYRTKYPNESYQSQKGGKGEECVTE